MTQPRHFTALNDFWSEETQSVYLGGFSYTASTPALNVLLDRWISEGKARLGRAYSAQINGHDLTWR